MGSYATSNNTSATVNQNLPVSQQDVTNPINLVNAAGNKLNSSEITGSNYSSNTNYSSVNSLLDGGSIARAFDFGTVAISKIADLTTSLNAQTAQNNKEALNAVVTSGASLTGILDRNVNKNQSETADWMQNPRLIVAAVAVAVAFMYFKKG